MLGIFIASSSLTLFETIYVTVKWSCKFHLEFEQRPKITKAFTRKRMLFDKEYKRYSHRL